MSGNKVHGRMCGPNRGEVTGDKKIACGALKMYCVLDVRIVKPRMR
jgi:hypothetical protein